MMLQILPIALPFLGFLLAAPFGLSVGRWGNLFAQTVTCLCITAAAIAAWFLFSDVALAGNAREVVLLQWLAGDKWQVSWGLRLDTLSTVMVLVVTSVSALVHFYSLSYMEHDHAKARFMAYLSFFTAAMLLLVTADNLLQLFVGWEGVGFASYLLIGFWYKKQSAASAAIKAFVVNRIGDAAFLLGIAACFMIAGSFNFSEIFAALPNANATVWSVGGISVSAVTVAALLLFTGAMAKSAQIGLHTWLPDAMEGPTPVSALIHAATMVTAGIFMVARMSPLFAASPAAMAFVAIVGAVTAFVAATIAVTQFDIKRVIAYSTMSQLGYMVMALGVAAWQASLFHLVTHAFFKALLFLGAGSVIHACSGEQDMRKMGGLARRAPLSCALMWIGTLSLAGLGIPGWGGFAGFYSKDAILEAIAANHSPLASFIWGVGMAGVFLTAFYSVRMLMLVFHSAPREDDAILRKVHESPLGIILPTLPLAVAAVGLGAFLNPWFMGDMRNVFWGVSFDVAGTSAAMHHELASWQVNLPSVLAAFGIVCAMLIYGVIPRLPSQCAHALGALFRLVKEKYYIDELYDLIIVKPIQNLGSLLWRRVDDKIIDAFIVDKTADITTCSSRGIVLSQNGLISLYVFAALAALVLIMCWMVGRTI